MCGRSVFRDPSYYLVSRFQSLAACVGCARPTVISCGPTTSTLFQFLPRLAVWISFLLWVLPLVDVFDYSLRWLFTLARLPSVDPWSCSARHLPWNIRLGAGPNTQEMGSRCTLSRSFAMGSP